MSFINALGYTATARNKLDLQNFLRAQNEYNKKLRVSLISIMISIVIQNPDLFNKKLSNASKDNNDWKAIANYLRYKIAEQNNISFASMFQTLVLPKEDHFDWLVLLNEIKTLEKEAKQIRRRKNTAIFNVDNKIKPYDNSYIKAYADAKGVAKNHFSGLPKELQELYQDHDNLARLLLLYDRKATSEKLEAEITNKDLNSVNKTKDTALLQSLLSDYLVDANNKATLQKEIVVYHRVKHSFDNFVTPLLSELVTDVLSKYTTSEAKFVQHLQEIQEYVDLSIRYSQQYVLTTFLEKLLDGGNKNYDASFQLIETIETFIFSEWSKLSNPQFFQNSRSSNSKINESYKKVFEKYKLHKSNLGALPSNNIKLFAEHQFILYSLYKDCWAIFELYEEKGFMQQKVDSIKESLHGVGHTINSVPGVNTASNVIGNAMNFGKNIMTFFMPQNLKAQFHRMTDMFGGE